MKTCNKCLVNKNLNEFFNDKNSGDGKYSICKNCKQKSTYKWRENNKNKYNEGAKKWRHNNPEKEYGHEIKRRYGLTLEQYNKMLTTQQNKCAICLIIHNSDQKKGRLYVDHDHKTGIVRGLLCSSCNSALGYFKDNISLLENAILYLKQS